MSRRQTLFGKLWAAHEILRREDGVSLLWVDRHLVHEGSHHAFAKIAARGLPIVAPDNTVAVVDHYAPTRGRSNIIDPQIARMIDTLRQNAENTSCASSILMTPRRALFMLSGRSKALPCLVC